ncbi:MAG: LysR substrate-binding domain-containing protein [Myxococcota bacterium]
MNEIDISTIDLNLLVTLDALLAEGSVTRAARRLGIGQPAASHALGRLRELFEDPLFVRAGRAVVPTPRADALREPLARLLADVARLVRHEVEFDAATTTRSFVLICPDLLAPLLPRMSARLQGVAPRASLEVRNRSGDDARALELGQADLAVGPGPAEGAGLQTRGLGTIHWGVVARRSHPAFARGRRLRARAWAEHPHVLVKTGSSSRSFVAAALERAGVSRRIGLVVPTFLAALVAVAETDLFFAAPRELVAPLLPRLDLVVVSPPIEIPVIPIVALWHERYHADPAHRFFRGVVVDEFEASLKLRGRSGKC